MTGPMTTGAIALVDLDDTLFQTLRKCPPDVARDRLTPVGYARDGGPLSYATPRQMRLIEWLLATAHVVPVTARSVDALSRVRLSFAQAICAHGGVILDGDGAAERDWQATIRDGASICATQLDAFAAAITDAAGRLDVAVAARVLSEDGCPMYVVAKHADADAAALSRVVDAALDAAFDSGVPGLPAGWTDHRNGNNVALLPPHLGKHHAVAHLLPRLRERWPDLPVIALGDSVTDQRFMAMADFAAMPAGSQLARVVARAV